MLNIAKLKGVEFFKDVALAKDKDEEAFKRLININKNKLYRIGKGILKSDFDVDDAMQETVLKAWLKLNTLKNENSFSTWITRILINECYEIIRRRKSTISIEEHEIKDKDSSLEVNHKIDVWKALDKLNDDFKIPLILFFFEEFSYDEISSILKIPKGTVRSRISRGKEKIEGILSNYSRGEKYE